ALIVVEADMERCVSTAVVATTGGEVHAAAREQIESSPLLRDPDRVVQWRDGDGRRKPYLFSSCGDIGQHEIRAGQNAERVEMMLADPGRMHAKLIGVECLRGDVRNKGLGVTLIIFVVIIAKSEVAELHDVLPGVLFH